MQDPRLGTQSKGRAVSEGEAVFANQLERIYETGCHDFDAVAEKLNEAGAARPSGETGPWTRDVLETELKAINASHDEAHAAHGIGA